MMREIFTRLNFFKENIVVLRISTLILKLLTSNGFR